MVLKGRVAEWEVGSERKYIGHFFLLFFQCLKEWKRKNETYVTRRSHEDIT